MNYTNLYCVVSVLKIKTAGGRAELITKTCISNSLEYECLIPSPEEGTENKGSGAQVGS